jgi:threonine dehydrogenase-like Zn-dependent dehydrogenase
MNELTSYCDKFFPDYPAAMDLLAQGKVSIKEMIIHNFRLDQFVEAFDVVVHKEEHNSIKVIIVP